jgi:hypothetical protein
MATGTGSSGVLTGAGSVGEVFGPLKVGVTSPAKSFANRFMMKSTLPVMPCNHLSLLVSPKGLPVRRDLFLAASTTFPAIPRFSCVDVLSSRNNNVSFLAVTLNHHLFVGKGAQRIEPEGVGGAKKRDSSKAKQSGTKGDHKANAFDSQRAPNRLCRKVSSCLFSRA